MERYLVIVCSVQNGHRSLLLTPDGESDPDRWRLPDFSPATEVYNTDLRAASVALNERFGGVTEMRTRYAVRVPNGGAPLNVYFTEPISGRIASATADGSRWFFVEELSALDFSSPIQGELLLAWLRELADDSEAALLPWWREGWIAGAEKRLRPFVDGRERARSVPVEQVRCAFTSAVLRVRTNPGAVFLKAVPSPFVGEVRLTKLLGEWHPDHLPVVLNSAEINAARLAPTELILSDVGGEPVGSQSPLSAWIETAHRYACIQSDSVGRVAELLEIGCTDLRVATLRNHVDEFCHRLQPALKGSPAGLTEEEWIRLDALLPHFRAALGRLAEAGIPDCLEHGDLHVGNIRWDAAKNRPVFMDWSHACITFPFYGYGTLLLDDGWFGPDIPTAPARVEWAYLATWAAYAGPEQLSEAFVTWKPLRYLFIAERQMRIIASFQSLWAESNRGALSPCGDALRQLQWWLRDAIRRLIAAHADIA